MSFWTARSSHWHLSILVASAVVSLMGTAAVLGAQLPGPANKTAVTPARPDQEKQVLEEEVPEIEVEVVAVREGLLSISPASGETITEVGAQEIEDSGAQTLIEAVTLTPSVFVRNQDGARYENRLSIRGAAPRLVLLDGIPIAREGYTGLAAGAGGKETGYAGRILYTLPVEIIERIDVIRSVGTIVYGPTAATGAVINIVTKEPEVGAENEASASFGSYSQKRAHVLAQASDGRLAYLFEVGMDRADSHLELGQKRFNNAFGKIIYNEPDGSKLLLDYFALDGRRTLDLSQDFSIAPARYWRISPWEEEFVNVVWSKTLGEDITLDLAFYRRQRDFITNLYTDADFTAVKRSWVDAQDDLGTDLRYSVRSQDGRMTRAGVQWAKITSDTLDTTYIGGQGPLPTPKVLRISQERKTKSLFWAETMPLRSDLRVSVGARYDDPTGYDAAFTYSVGVEANVTGSTTWHLHFGTGREHPIPTDGDIQQGIEPPEARTCSAETGWTVHPDASSRWAVNIFWTNTRDARILYNDPPGAVGADAYISKSEDLTTWGTELTYDRSVNDNLKWFASYTYLREKVTNNNNPFIPGPLYPTVAEPPTHIAAAGIRADIAKTRIALSARCSDDYVAMNRRLQYATPVESFMVLSLKLTRATKSGEISLFVDNLLDAEYETMPAFPRPGRNYLISYSQPF
jgi:iron complex outermembrane receptor protein